MFDVLYVPVTDQSPVVRLLRATTREAADEATGAFARNDPQGDGEYTYQVRAVPVDGVSGAPVDGIAPGRPTCPPAHDGPGCGSARLTWTSGEVFRCRSCGAEFTGDNAGWAPA